MAEALGEIREPDRPHLPNRLGSVSKFSSPGKEAVRTHVPGLEQLPCKSSDLQRRNMAICKSLIAQTSLRVRALRTQPAAKEYEPKSPTPADFGFLRKPETDCCGRNFPDANRLQNRPIPKRQ